LREEGGSLRQSTLRICEPWGGCGGRKEEWRCSGRRSGVEAEERGVELKQRKEEWRKEEVEGEWRGEGH